MFWTHQNLIWSVIAAICLGVLSCLEIHAPHEAGQLLVIKIAIIVIPITYLPVGFFLSRSNLHQSNDFEINFIIELAIEQLKSK
jgi:hypothetical protein